MTARRTASKQSNDAIALLKADHDKVKKLFKEFERLHEDDDEHEAGQVAQLICNELTVHATVEEEIFYPEVRAAIDDDDLMDEAVVEHATAKDLIAQIEGMRPSDGQYAAKVIVLGEYVNHHVKEEQDELFPQARKAGVDMKALGARILARQQELKAERGLVDEADGETRQNSHTSSPAKSNRTREASRA